MADAAPVTANEVIVEEKTQTDFRSENRRMAEGNVQTPNQQGGPPRPYEPAGHPYGKQGGPVANRDYEQKRQDWEDARKNWQQRPGDRGPELPPYNGPRGPQAGPQGRPGPGQGGRPDIPPNFDPNNKDSMDSKRAKALHDQYMQQQAQMRNQPQPPPADRQRQQMRQERQAAAERQAAGVATGGKDSAQIERQRAPGKEGLGQPVPVHKHDHDEKGDGLIHHGSHTHTKEQTLRDTGYIFTKLHPGTYKVFTLLGIWIAPIAWGYFNSWWKVEIVWGTVTFISGYIVWIATRNPLAKSTPRTVYAYLRVLYKINTSMLFGGNMLVLADFLGLPLLILGWPTGKLSLYGWWFCFVGLYFGLLLRDFSDVCSARMASTMGYYSKDGLPSKTLQDGVCAICDEDMPRDHELQARGTRLFKLNCGHRFHESCLRGWTVIGKKEVCPACSEKVDMKQLRGAFWETFSSSANCILDWLREMVVFTPCIILLTKFLLVLIY
eukprot:g61128.t1